MILTRSLYRYFFSKLILLMLLGLLELYDGTCILIRHDQFNMKRTSYAVFTLSPLEIAKSLAVPSKTST